MNKKLLITIASLLIVGLVVFGGVRLYNKLNEVRDLKSTIAEENGGVEATSKPEDGTDNGDGDGSTDAGSGDNTPDNGSDGSGNDGEGVSSQPGESQQPVDDRTGATAKPGTSGDGGTATEKPGTSGGGTDVTAKPEATPSPSDGSGGGISPGTTPTPKPTEQPSAEEQEKAKREIDAAITTKMEQLSASCKATSDSLVQEIAAELTEDPDATLDTIQKKFLVKVFAAEANCDSSFTTLLNEAKAAYSQAGLSEEQMPGWAAQYESAKAQARKDAISALASALQ
ncbi:hypothetical protein M6D81_08570 [Paenibacillus sp. J5C_2022]|uniref:hypothetical protein n=1 Tax=Paenibacillus sp. J5C2022 TaxID=2977129 RepID=UPI0021D1CE8A|nr:hypothetical protein [Paenibacillus sp. J5C2022]MCU6708771.1 hypothetical protein [Paenibacillus sp. J5C2022]